MKVQLARIIASVLCLSSMCYGSANAQQNAADVQKAKGDTDSSAKFCLDKSETEIASRMLETGVIKDGTNDKINGGLNWFTAKCLGMNSWKDYRDIQTLNLQATVSSSDGVLEVGYGFTNRWLATRINESSDNETKKTSDTQKFHTNYRTLRLAVFGNPGDATSVTIFDLDKFRFGDGLGIKGGIEFGKHASKKRGKLEGDINAALATARASCINTRSIADPLAKLPKGTDESDRPSQLTYRSRDDVLLLCSGPNLLTWLRKDKSGSWSSIVKPVWGYEDKPVLYGGFEFSYFWSETSFYALHDTNTGDLTGIDLPADFLAGKGATKVNTSPFAGSLYVGGTWPLFLSSRGEKSREHGKDDKTSSIGTVSLSGSLSYRRSFDVPKSYKKQTVCVDVTGNNYDQCRDVNIAAPYEQEGLVAATALKFQMSHLGFLPEFGIAFKPSYAFDIDQMGLEIPIYFLSDSKGNLNSGIKIACTDDGVTDGGYKISGECGAAFFIGKKFTLGGKP